MRRAWNSTFYNQASCRQPVEQVEWTRGRVEKSEMRLLLIEDNDDVADAIVTNFRRQGDAIDHAGSVQAGISHLAADDYAVVVLDIGLPDGSGIDLLRRLRQQGNTVAVLVLTARLGIEDRVSSLDLGADDYLVKPFDVRELAARVRALARRSSPPLDAIIGYGDLFVDAAGKTARIGQRALELSRREFSLLEALLDHRGRVVSKERLHSRIYAFDEQEVGTNAIELSVSRLRRKLADSRVSIRTLRGLGYQIRVADDDVVGRGD